MIIDCADPELLAEFWSQRVPCENDADRAERLFGRLNSLLP